MTPDPGSALPASPLPGLRPAPRLQAGRTAKNRRAAAPSVRHVRTFAATFDQVGQARRFLAGLAGDGDEARDAITCLSELATNACLHSASARPGGAYTVRVIVTPGSDLRIEVTDQGGPWHPAENDDARPHGLAIVAALARDAGITGSQAAGWTAWATFPLPAQDPDHRPARTAEPARQDAPEARAADLVKAGIHD